MSSGLTKESDLTKSLSMAELMKPGKFSELRQAFQKEKKAAEEAKKEKERKEAIVRFEEKLLDIHEKMMEAVEALSLDRVKAGILKALREDKTCFDFLVWNVEENRYVEEQCMTIYNISSFKEKNHLCLPLFKKVHNVLPFAYILAFISLGFSVVVERVSESWEIKYNFFTVYFPGEITKSFVDKSHLLLDPKDLPWISEQSMERLHEKLELNKQVLPETPPASPERSREESRSRSPSPKRVKVERTPSPVKEESSTPPASPKRSREESRSPSPKRVKVERTPSPVKEESSTPLFTKEDLCTSEPQQAVEESNPITE